jgi:hypothetical protein
MSEHNHNGKGPSAMQIIGSVLAAGFGVQSEKNRARDFKSGSGKDFILVGLAATVLFVLTLYTIVRLVLAFAGV